MKDATTKEEKNVRHLEDSEVVYYSHNKSLIEGVTAGELGMLGKRYQAILALEQHKSLRDACKPGLIPVDLQLKENLHCVVNRLLTVIEHGNKLVDYEHAPESKKQLQKATKELKAWSKSFKEYDLEREPEDFDVFIQELKQGLKEVEGPKGSNAISNSPSSFTLSCDEVINYADRVCNLPRVQKTTEQQTAKQTNVALAKTLSALELAHANLELTLDQKNTIEAYIKRVKRRMKISARNSGADFESCDSSLIDLPSQIERAERKYSGPA